MSDTMNNPIKFNEVKPGQTIRRIVEFTVVSVKSPYSGEVWVKTTDDNQYILTSIDNLELVEEEG